ncbi:MAG: PIN domain-containing protein [Dermatophilaceae bacterium]
MLVDTSVWSLALRRDRPSRGPELGRLSRALAGRELVATTGVVLQEILQGAVTPTSRAAIIERFAALEFLLPDRDDHIAAAEMRNECRRHGVQLGTIDALIAALAIRHDATLLTIDQDFAHAAQWIPLRLG